MATAGGAPARARGGRGTSLAARRHAWRQDDTHAALKCPGTAAPSSLSPDQRQAALEKAGAARRLRAELKEKLKMGSLASKELLDQA